MTRTTRSSKGSKTTTRKATAKVPATKKVVARVAPSQVGVPKGKKRCSKSGKVYAATTEFFYRDKSQKDGLSPWSKDAERAYNKAYYAGLKAAKAPKVAEITTPKAKKAFAATMAPERVTRKKAAAKA